MATPRKKWATRWDTLPGGRQTRPSKTAAYTWVQEQARALARGEELRATTVFVEVDEGWGHGWERYETLDLAELAKTSYTQ